MQITVIVEDSNLEPAKLDLVVEQNLVVINLPIGRKAEEFNLQNNDFFIWFVAKRNPATNNWDALYGLRFALDDAWIAFNNAVADVSWLQSSNRHITIAPIQFKVVERHPQETI